MRKPSTSTTAITLARVGVLLVVAVVAATAVWLGTRSDDHTGSERAGDGQGSSSSAEVDNPTTESEQTAPQNAQLAPADGVTLPSGAEVVDGRPTGFPYTDLGAVALQAELAKAQIGFDYDQAAAVARLYGDPEDQAVFEDRSRAAVALRRQQAGVPAEGEVVAPASYAVTPLAYTLEELDTDYYVVNLLSYITLTTVDGESRDELYAGTQLVRWIPDSAAGNGGDWKVVQGSTADIEKLVDEGQPQAVAPGTPEFEQAGWIILNITGSSAAPATGAGESS